jgi:uncharacterized membrane protein
VGSTHRTIKLIQFYLNRFASIAKPLHLCGYSKNLEHKIMTKIYIMVGVIVALLVVQLYLRFKVKKEKAEREERRFGN